MIALLRFETAVQEVFAVTLLPGRRYPDLINDDEKLLENSFVVPDRASRPMCRGDCVRGRSGPCVAASACNGSSAPAIVRDGFSSTRGSLTPRERQKHELQQSE